MRVIVIITAVYIMAAYIYTMRRNSVSIVIGVSTTIPDGVDLTQAASVIMSGGDIIYNKIIITRGKRVDTLWRYSGE